MPVLLLLSKNRRGFTLIEVVMATFILTVGVLGSFSLVQRITTVTLSVSSQLEALYLAQEGIENIRNIRDSNWLEQRTVPTTDWAEGISTTNWESVGKFQRKITIQNPQSGKMIVSVEVQWLERGGTRQLKAETELYDWR